MSNNYRFYVEAMTGDAVAKLEEINRLMDKIESKSAKGTQDFFHTNQRTIDENINDMQRIIKIKKELDSAFEKDIEVFGKGGSMEGVIKARKNLEDLQDSFREVQSEFSKVANMKANPNFINQSTLRTQKAYRDELTETEKSLQRIKRETQEVIKLESRVKHRANSAVATGHMNHTQANTFKKDVNAVSDLEAMRGNNQEKRQKLRSRYEKDNRDLAELRSNTTMDKQVRKNQETAIQERIKGTEKEIELVNKLDDTIDRVIENLKTAKNQVESAGVSVSADRDSIIGTMSSRAPSIAMASIGAFVGTIGSLYSRGATANAGMRDSTISIGQRTGSSDFRALRKEMQMMGIDRSLGYKGADMLAFQDSALSNIGFTNKEDLVGTTEALAKGSRAVPVDSETLNNFMNSAMQSGSVSDKGQVKAIQEAFLGAIQQSGMVGREKEQLEALSSISDNLFSGRNGSNEELQNAMAIQTLFAQSGDRSLQGEAGAQAISSLNEGMRGAIDNPILSKIFGMGTKYQRIGGKYALQEQLEKGISDPDNLKTAFNYAKINGGGSIEGEKGAFSQITAELGQRLTTDQIDGIYKATNNGESLTDETLDKLKKKNLLSGSDQYDKNSESYTDSNEATDNASEAVTEKMASEVHDAGTKLRDVNASLGHLNGAIYALILALTASGGAITTSGAMSIGAGTIKKATQTAFSAGGTGAVAGKSLGAVDDIAGAFSAGKATGGWKAGLKGAGGTAKEFLSTQKGYASLAYQQGGMKGLLKQGGNFLGDLFGGGGAVGAVDDVANAGASVAKGGKLAGLFGKGLGAVGKFATPLMIAGEAINVLKSEDKVKATGEGAGGIGGALGGASLGASIGTAILPGVGTAVGGIIGTIAGTSVGRKIGGTAVDLGRSAWGGIKDFFHGTDAEASELESGAGTSVKKENTAKGKEDKDNVNKKVTAEKQREINNSTESANLSLYAKLLDRAEQILNRARSQNGIFGNSSDSSGSSSSGSGSDSVGSGGSLNVLGDNKKWTNTDITKHDLGSTVGGLTAEQLDKWIDSNAPANSPMRGLGATFLQAGKESGLDPRYLVAHAALETGWGTSNLSGNGDAKNGNWFGIGAFDDNPNNGFNYSDGIVGGAKWIAENYYKNEQTSLYDMVNDPSGHNYATDPDWANKIASIMGSSDKYTTGTAQTFKSENNVTVNVTGTSASATRADLNQLGTQVGKVMTDTMSDSALFFAKEMKRL